MKRYLSITLMVALLLSSLCFVSTVNAVNDMPFSLNASAGEENTVLVEILTNQEVNFTHLSMFVEYDTAVFTRNGNGQYISGFDTGYDISIDGFFISAEDGATIPADTVVGTYEFTYSENIEADEYIFELNLNEYYSTNGDDLLPADPTATAVFSIEDATPESTSTAYAVTLAGTASNSNPVRVDETLKVNVGVNKDFAATEMTIRYDSALVSFDEENSDLDTATIEDNAGTLTLVDYGKNKTTASDNYVLAFTANGVGNAEFSVTEAGFGTAADAINKNLTVVDPNNLGTVSIEIKPVAATVTFMDKLFFSASTTVEIGETFTFYPETATGAYYDYETPTVTMVGADSVTVVETADGGWKIENVIGDITINAAVRTPTSFGDVSYTADADVVTNATTTATYNTPIYFTVAAGQPATDTAEGYEYVVSVTIGETSYNPSYNTNADGTLTYEIPGIEVKGEVAITVTRNPLAANKYTVSIEGAGKGDGQFDGATAPGLSIQVDKTNTASATLTVDKTSGLNKGYEYEVKVGDQVLEEVDGKYTIENISANTVVTINKTVIVEGVQNAVEGDDGQDKNYLNVGEGETAKKMWLIQLPNHVENTTTATYTYDGKEMYWSADHGKFVIVVFSNEAPVISADKFGLVDVTATPQIASEDWDVNKSGAEDANDAQMIWNMYKSYYTDFSESADGATMEKFLLADANHDGILDTKDAVVIIDKILEGNN